jgi:hypothetical protein
MIINTGFRSELNQCPTSYVKSTIIAMKRNKNKKRDEELPILKGKTYKRLTEYLNDTTMSLSVNPQGMGGIVRQPTLVDDNLKVSRVYNSVYYSIKF